MQVGVGVGVVLVAQEAQVAAVQEQYILRLPAMLLQQEVLEQQTLVEAEAAVRPRTDQIMTGQQVEQADPVL